MTFQTARNDAAPKVRYAIFITGTVDRAIEHGGISGGELKQLIVSPIQIRLPFFSGTNHQVQPLRTSPRGNRLRFRRRPGFLGTEGKLLHLPGSDRPLSPCCAYLYASPTKVGDWRTPAFFGASMTYDVRILGCEYTGDSPQGPKLDGLHGPYIGAESPAPTYRPQRRGGFSLGLAPGDRSGCLRNSSATGCSRCPLSRFAGPAWRPAPRRRGR
jgi:hypothetical protein